MEASRPGAWEPADSRGRSPDTTPKPPNAPSFTHQILQRGLHPVVVGRDGRAYDIDGWPASATYRAGGQQNLLVRS